MNINTYIYIIPIHQILELFLNVTTYKIKNVLLFSISLFHKLVHFLSSQYFQTRWKNLTVIENSLQFCDENKTK